MSGPGGTGTVGVMSRGVRVPSSPPERRSGVLLPRRRWVRAAAAAAGVAWLPAGAAVVAFTSVASARFGWAYAAVIFGSGLFGAAWAFGVDPRAGAVVMLPALLLGVVMYQWAPPDHGRIRHVAEGVGVGVEGWDLVADSDYGNTWCWQGCPAVSYFYLTPESADGAVATFARRLAADGWTGGTLSSSRTGPSSEYDPRAVELWRKGDWTVLLRVSSASFPPQWAKGADTRLTPLEVTYSAR